MSVTCHVPVFPAARRRKPGPKAAPADPRDIGRSPHFVPGWWLVGAALFYIAVALVCIFAF